jgi:hypothetical protein
MVSLLYTKFHEILFSSFRGVALTNCVTDRRADGQDKNNMSPHKSGGDILLMGRVMLNVNICRL